MNLKKKAAFSPNGEYFAFATEKGLLKIWETASNTVKQQHALHSSVNFTCSSLTWGLSTQKFKFFDETDTVDDSIQPINHQCLVIGSETGEVLLYDFTAGKFLIHFVSAQNDAITDICWHSDTNRLFSCSKDKSIAVWDIASGKLNSKWKADDKPLYSICVIDNENLLSASTSILWWNIKEQTVIKKFSGHNTEILTLLPVISTDKSSNSYFLSVAEGDSKINAWHLSVSNSVSPVASFDLPDDLENIEVTKYFSKEKPMFLSAVTKGGSMLLFKHVLNGKPRKNLLPQMTLHVVSKPTGDCNKPSSIPVIASKFSGDTDSCIIVYGSIGNPTFEKVKILDCSKTITLSREKRILCNDSSEDIISQVKIYNKLGEYISANGKLPTVTLFSSPKRKKQKDPDINTRCTSEVKNYNKALSPDHRTATTSSPNTRKKQRKIDKKLVSPENCAKIRKDIILSDPSNVIDNLLCGLQTEDRSLLNMVLLCSDDELIRNSVLILPTHSLRLVLTELHKRLVNQEERYIYSARKWLKEILNIHLQYLTTDKDLVDILNLIRDFIDQQRVSETLSKLSILKGLLNIQRIQHLSSEESDSSESDTEDRMES